jgi:hypothetical protein
MTISYKWIEGSVSVSDVIHHAFREFPPRHNCWELRRRVSRHFMCYLAFIQNIWGISSPDSALGIATGYGLDDRRIGVRAPVGIRIWFFRNAQTGSEVHQTSCQIGTGGSFPGGKVVGEWSLTTHLQLVPKSRKCGSIHPLPHTSSWRSA